MNKLIYLFVVVLFAACSDRHKQYRVVGEFSLYSLTPHGLGTKQYFLQANGRKYGPLEGYGKSRIAVLNSNSVVFFTMTTKSGYVFNLLALTNNQLTEIEVPGHGPLGEVMCSPFPQNQDVVQGISNSIISVISIRGNERTIYEFDVVRQTCREIREQ